jgi:phenylpyruvate tautomerase PptA (4-oxalocrotonate tautomerase family)
MPCLRIDTSVSVPESKQAELLAALSKAVAGGIGKPELYVMVGLHTSAMLMSGQGGPAAFADLRSIGGLGGDVPRRLTATLCNLLQTHLAIPPERVFICFTDVSGRNWGWNGETLG